MKHYYDEDEVIALVSYVNKNDRWIIDSMCLHHMTGDKSKFITLNYYNGNSVRFGNYALYLVKRKGFYQTHIKDFVKMLIMLKDLTII